MSNDSIEKFDSAPIPQQISIPSLWLYAVMILIAVLLIVAAFQILGKPDWSSLLLNVGAGLIGSVVVIVVVDRRMRASELSALRSIPSRTKFTLRLFLSPSLQIANAYSQSLLLELEPQLRDVIDRPVLSSLTSKVEAGFVLIAEPAFGKTVWTRQVAAYYARRFLDGGGDAKIVVLVPLRVIRNDTNLMNAVSSEVQVRTRCSVARVERLIRSGRVMLILDGYDEVPNHLRDTLSSDLENFRARHPHCPVTISSRPVSKIPMTGSSVEIIAPPSEQELQEMRRRLTQNQDRDEDQERIDGRRLGSLQPPRKCTEHSLFVPL